MECGAGRVAMVMSIGWREGWATELRQPSDLNSGADLEHLVGGKAEEP